MENQNGGSTSASSGGMSPMMGSSSSMSTPTTEHHRGGEMPRPSQRRQLAPSEDRCSPAGPAAGAGGSVGASWGCRITAAGRRDSGQQQAKPRSDATSRSGAWAEGSAAAAAASSMRRRRSDSNARDEGRAGRRRRGGAPRRTTHSAGPLLSPRVAVLAVLAFLLAASVPPPRRGGGAGGGLSLFRSGVRLAAQAADDDGAAGDDAADDGEDDAAAAAEEEDDDLVDLSGVSFEEVSVMPVSCLRYNNGHMIKFEFFENTQNYQCHFKNLGTFVVSIAHYMRAYFNNQALIKGRDFKLPGDAGYLNCVLLRETAYTGQKLYAKIGCMERETFTSTKLQLHVYEDAQCSQIYEDGRDNRQHVKNGYDINGYSFSTKVSFRPPFYTCQTCSPDQVSDSFRKSSSYWYDDDYISIYGKRAEYDDAAAYDDANANGDDANAAAGDDGYAANADDANANYYQANDDTSYGDDANQQQAGDDDYYKADDANGDDDGGNGDDGGNKWSNWYYKGNNNNGYKKQDDDDFYSRYDDDRRNLAETTTAVDSAAAGGGSVRGEARRLEAAPGQLEAFEREFWEGVELQQQQKVRRVEDADGAAGDDDGGQYGIGDWNMCERIYRYGLWCDSECRALDTFRSDEWSASDIFLLVIMCLFMAAMMLLVFAKRVKAYEKASIYGDDVENPYPGLPPMAMVLVYILIMTIILVLANLKFVNETLVFAVVTCILLFIYMLKLTLFESRKPALLPTPQYGGHYGFD